jgi:putative intracellular protease/amidase
VHRRTLITGLGASAALALGGVPLANAARDEFSDAPPVPDGIPPAEHEVTIEALRPPKRRRPLIAIVALNIGTEVCDVLSTYGVLSESGLADVAVVAEREGPIQLYPGNIRVGPQATMARFDASHPDGADYVVVPAMEPHDDPAVVAFIKAQREKGAKIVAVCNGALTLSAAGLLDGRKATGHWYYIEVLQKKHPTMQWVRDRRYVVDRDVATSTGVTASLPLMTALVEAIGGRSEAEKLAARLGVDDWDARHNTQAFQLGYAHRKTYVLNRLAVWRHEGVGISLDDNVDEIALGLMVDAWSRTELAKVTAFGGTSGSVHSKRGLHLLLDKNAAAAGALHVPGDDPARILERELPRIERRYDRPTALLAALTMEYDWPGRERIAQD